MNALVAATHLLIPVQSSYFALEGTDDLLETVDRIRARPNPDLKLLGAVITLHDKRTTLARDVQKAVTEVFAGRVFETTISKSIRLEESPAHRETIFTFAAQSSGAYEYYKLCEEVLERIDAMIMGGATQERRLPRNPEPGSRGADAHAKEVIERVQSPAHRPAPDCSHAARHPLRGSARSSATRASDA